MGGSRGGGGSTGKIKFPHFIDWWHEAWLRGYGVRTRPAHAVISPWTSGAAHEDDYDVSTDIVAGIISNPFKAAQEAGNAGYNVYDPRAKVEEVYQKYKDFEQVLEEAISRLGCSSLESIAEAYIERLGVGDDAVSDIAGRYETAIESVQSGSLARYYSGLGDILGQFNSAYSIGASYLDATADYDLEEVRLAAEMKNAFVKAELSVGSIGEIARALMQRVGMYQLSLQLFSKMKLIEIVTDKETLDRDFGINIDNALWDLELYPNAANALAAPGGASSPSRSGDYNQFSGKSVLASGSDPLSGIASTRNVAGVIQTSGGVIGGSVSSSRVTGLLFYGVMGGAGEFLS